MSGSVPIRIFVCRSVIKGVALVMMVSWYSGVLVRVSRSARDVVTGLVGIQWRYLFDVVAVEVVYVRVQHSFTSRLSSLIVVTCCRGYVAVGEVIRISRSFVVHEIMVTLRMGS